MAKSGPQRYPGASTAHWYQTRFGGDSMESNVIVWHTTEGTSLPSYNGGSEAPNFTAVPDWNAERIVWHQHFDFDTSSRALVNKAGGVETNTLNVCQVELVGTCDPTTHKKWGGTRHLYTADLPDWVIRDLAAFACWAHQQHGVPLTSGVTFKAYPGSYGSNGVRMSATAWTGFRGHCGHQHVPENDHGDPGALPMAAILAAASGGGVPVSPSVSSKDTDMPKYVNLGISKPYTLKPGGWDSIEYTSEWTDEAGDHGADGSVFAHGACRFTGSISLRVAGLAPGETVQARMSEYAGGLLVQDHPIHEVIGTGGDAFAVVPLVKHCGPDRGMRVRLLNTSDQPVTISSATLTALIWKESGS